MSDAPKPVAVRIVRIVLLALLAYFAVVFFSSRGLVFQAKTSVAERRPAGAEHIWFESPEQKTEAWFLPPTVAPQGPAPLIIFAHGGPELIDDWASAFAPPRARGIGVLLVEFPGYGRSTGSPSEASVKAALQQGYDWATKRPDIDPTKIILYGRAVGGAAVATLIDGTNKPAALILESTFSNGGYFAKRFFAPGFLARDRFDTLSAVERYKGQGPILVIHGSSDEVIEPNQAAILATAAGTEPIFLECGHFDCPRVWTQNVFPALIAAKVLAESAPKKPAPPAPPAPPVVAAGSGEGSGSGEAAGSGSGSGAK